MSGWSQDFKKGFFVGAGFLGAVFVIGFLVKKA